MAVKWYEFKGKFTRQIHKVCNPTFVIEGGNWLVSAYYTTEAEFNRVLAEWEADQVEQCGNSNSIPVKGDPEKGGQQQWVPKVGDWVRVKESARTDKGALFQVKATWGAGVFLPNGSAISNDWLEPAEPQPIDKLGWWLIDGDLALVQVQDATGNTMPFMAQWVATDDDHCQWLDETAEGIFIAKITDEELIAYHREGIVPKCPVEV